MQIPVGLQWIFRLVVGGVFIFFGGSKLFDQAGFASSIFNYQLVPRVGINVMAIILPWIELIAGLVLVVGPWRREAATLTAGMLVMFITAVSYAIVKGLDIECGCDITGGSKVSWLLVGMDSGLLIMSLACMVACTPTRAGFPVETATPESGEA